MSTQPLLDEIQRHQVQEGCRAKTYRLIGTGKYRCFDPFVIIDHFSVEEDGGFPDHPHRGFQFLTLCLKGVLRHQDSTGVSLELYPGDMQCLNTGRGLVHSLFPVSTQSEAFIVWVNIPNDLRMTPPSCTVSKAHMHPTVCPSPGCTATVLVGQFMGVKSIIMTIVETVLLDVIVTPRNCSELLCPAGYNAVLYVLQGDIWLGTKCLHPPQSVCFNTNELPLYIGSVSGCRFLLLLGRPMGEPIVQQGPFVVAQQEEVLGCLQDFNLERNGFEGCASWRSESSYF